MWAELHQQSRLNLEATTRMGVPELEAEASLLDPDLQVPLRNVAGSDSSPASTKEPGRSTGAASERRPRPPQLLVLPLRPWTFLSTAQSAQFGPF